MIDKKIYFAITSIFFVVFQLILILMNRPAISVAIITVWGILMIYCLADFEKRLILFVFGITFFTFLLGRVVLVDIFPLFEEDPAFPNRIDSTVNIMLLVSLLALLGGYIAFEQLDKYKYLWNQKPLFNIDNNSNNVLIDYYKTVSKILFYCTFPFLVITTASQVLYVLKFGYLNYYTSYVLQIPYIIKKIGDFAQINLFVYLFCLPSKREARGILLLYILYLFLSLGTGQRFQFVCGLLILFIYFEIRNKENDENWINKKQIILIIILLPVFLSFLMLINSIRMNETVTFTGFLRSFFDFFYDLGSSCNVLKYEVELGNKLAHKYYCFGTIITFFKENLISRIAGLPTYSGNTVEHALKGYSYTHAISYAGWGSYYLAGNGMGSSYIAELYHAFSMPGIIIGNIFYAFLISKFYKFNSSSVLPKALMFYSLYNFLLAPRGPFDGFTDAIFNPTSIFAVLVIYIISKSYAKRQNAYIIKL